MKRILLGTAILLLSAPVQAGMYGDDLARCVVSSSSASEKADLVEWMFFAIALNPAVAPLANVPAERRVEADRATAKLFEKLLADRCAEQARTAVKYEGSGAVGEAFKLLGQVAAQEMFANPAVAKGAEKFAEYIDMAKMEAVFGDGK